MLTVYREHRSAAAGRQTAQGVRPDRIRDCLSLSLYYVHLGTAHGQDRRCRTANVALPTLAFVLASAHRRWLPRSLEVRLYEAQGSKVDADAVAGRDETMRRAGSGTDDLARPHVVGQALSSGYAEMAADEARETEAEAWSEALLHDIADEPRRHGR